MNAEVLGYAHDRQLELWGVDGDAEADEDIVPPEILAAVEPLSREHYDVPEMLNETFLDLEEIVKFLGEIRKFEPKHDDKLQKIVRLLDTKALAGTKVLIFTEFADTARYLKNQFSDLQKSVDKIFAQQSQLMDAALLAANVQ